MYTPNLPNGDATVLGIRLELDPQVALLTSLTKRPIRFKSRSSEMRIECSCCCIYWRALPPRDAQIRRWSELYNPPSRPDGLQDKAYLANRLSRAERDRPSVTFVIMLSDQSWHLSLLST